MKKRYICLIAILIIMGITNISQARVKSILVTDNVTQNLYEYSYEGLIEDYTNYLLEEHCPLWNDYISNVEGLVAFRDDLKGYVKYNVIEEDYTNKLLSGKGNNYNINDFTENASDDAILQPQDKIIKRILVNGVVESDTSNDSESLDVVDIY